MKPPTPLILNLTTCARLRGQQAAVDGDRARYWREMSSCMYLLGWWDAAADFSALGERRPS